MAWVDILRTASRDVIRRLFEVKVQHILLASFVGIAILLLMILLSIAI